MAENGTKVVLALGLGGVLLYFLLKKQKETPLTAGVAWESILPYLIIAYWWDGTEWVQVLEDTILIEGGTYSLQVSQACVLQYNGYYYELVEGFNEIVWQKGE